MQTITFILSLWKYLNRIKLILLFAFLINWCSRPELLLSFVNANWKSLGFNFNDRKVFPIKALIEKLKSVKKGPVPVRGDHEPRLRAQHAARVRR